MELKLRNHKQLNYARDWGCKFITYIPNLAIN